MFMDSESDVHGQRKCNVACQDCLLWNPNNHSVWKNKLDKIHMKSSKTCQRDHEWNHRVKAFKCQFMQLGLLLTNIIWIIKNVVNAQRMCTSNIEVCEWVDRALNSESKALVFDSHYWYKCLINFLFHAATVYPTVMGTWWQKKYVWVAEAACIRA